MGRPECISTITFESFNGGLLFQEASAVRTMTSHVLRTWASMGASYFRRHRPASAAKTQSRWISGFNGGLLFQEASGCGPGRCGRRLGASMGASYFRRHRSQFDLNCTIAFVSLQWGPPISGGIGGSSRRRRPRPHGFNGGLLFQEASAVRDRCTSVLA